MEMFVKVVKSIQFTIGFDEAGMMNGSFGLGDIKDSQKSLEEIDDKTLITLVGENLYSFTLITVREKALQTELRRRKKAIPPHFLRYVIGCCHEQTVDDEDLFNLKESNKSAVKISKES